MNHMKLFLPLIATVISASLAGADNRWNQANDPANMFADYETNINYLPKSGATQASLWSDTYWPSREGGAAFRWQLNKEDGSNKQSTDPHLYRLYSFYEISRLSSEDLDTLSPAEKFDIINGRYDYPTVRKEYARTHPSYPKWFGLCHAVAAVTTRYYEPQTTVRSFYLPDGSLRQMTFFSSDIKALLALSANRAGAANPGIGRLCGKSGSSAPGACSDVNPASFFLALTNMVGTLQEPLIMDVDPGTEVWNSVIKSYSAKITPRTKVSPTASPGTVREVRVDMTVRHTIGAKPQREAIGPVYGSKNYIFTLELNKYDEIIGGAWISETRPDVLWESYENPVVDPEMRGIEYLVRKR